MCLAVKAPPAGIPGEVVGRGAPSTTGLSLTAEGSTGNGVSADPAISSDGRFVAFQSQASDLVDGDGNGVEDVFLRDVQAQTISLVSRSTTGEEGLAATTQAAISGNGRFVAFQSLARNLVPGDTNGVEDVFLHDRINGNTTRISLSSRGRQGNARSTDPTVSWSGRFVAFVSMASNLVGSDDNGDTDVFVRDRWHGVTRLVSVARSAVQGNAVSADPAISDDGGVIVFHSQASNLVLGDRNRAQDIFVWLRTSGTLRRVNLSSTGSEADRRSTDPSISGSGRFVTYGSAATNLVPHDTNGVLDQFVYDRSAATTSRVSIANTGRQGNGTSCDATISRDGRYVAFASIATNLVPEDTQGWRSVFLRDRVAGTTTLISVSSDGTSGDKASADPRVSADGRFVTFRSAATNLVENDANRVTDVFLRGPLG